MLSAFRAQPIYELKQQDKSKIESVLAYGDRLLVGLSTGTLRIYRVNEVPETSPDATPSKTRAVDLVREEEKFSRRAIQQLAIIKEANILVSLSDGHVSIHDLQTFQLQEKLDKTKGATAFAVTSNVIKDPVTDIPSLVSRLAVAVKRRILWWSWQDMELSPEVQEITLPHSPKSLLWATGTKMLVGLDPGFSIIDIETLAVADVIKPTPTGNVRFGAVSSSGMGYMGMGSWVPKPMATNLTNNKMLIAKDVNTLFIDTDAKPADKRQIPWAFAPEALGYSYPYLLSLQQTAKGALDVRSPDTLNLLQTIPLPGASILHVPQPNISLAHAGKGFLVASDRCIWRMVALNYEAQVSQLVEKTKFDEAISLLNMLEDTLLKDKQGSIREISMLKAQNLFSQQKYRPALDLFTDVSAPPKRVVSLYPKSIAGDLSTIEEPTELTDTDEPSGETSAAEENSSQTEDQVKNTPTPTKSVLGKFKPSAVKDDSDTASIRSFRTTSEAPREKPAKDAPLTGSDLKAAVMALCSYLAQSRVQVQRHMNTDGTLKVELTEGTTPSFSNLIELPEGAENIDWKAELLEVAKLVDTTLFRAYMLALPSLAGPLFRLDNFCDPHVVEEKLYESGRYNDLIDFLYGKKLHREALELLEKFGRNEAAEEVMPALRGPDRTIGYLQNLPAELIDIILEFAEWPIKVDSNKGMEIFVADTKNAANLPKDKVLKFLVPLDKSLAVQYLEHVILELNDKTPEFHQKLVDLYLEKLRDREGSSDEERNQARTKLEEFLRNSTQYHKLKTFNQLPADDPDVYEARAIVLCAMGNHKQALQIYVFQIQDHEKAEEYCNKIYLSTSTSPAPVGSNPNTGSQTYEKSSMSTDPEDQQPNVYTTLLSLYLKPPSPHKVQWEPALQLLSKHGPRLPAANTLDLMPSDLHVSELNSYFLGRIRSANTVVREERIITSLQAILKTNLSSDLLLGPEHAQGKGGRSRRVVIREDDHCRVCHKRFGNSAVRVYPDNEVIHYGCVGRSGVQRMKAGQGQGLQGLRVLPWG
ncbi:hypothetical protein D6D20_04547 [Aureobasidium pullulans]|uniref:CNH domain-containing protein n=1 Tax=Aureobasidium pullulans TaxID=5580 RepID=A0A4S8ZCA3_AURPU|nr:hypothetical protein D6D20_04547 [Aureobasidium pullulans]THZ97497.1 hypothetical protein D6C82_06405 [Aureobasidium pullulans]